MNPIHDYISKDFAAFDLNSEISAVQDFFLDHAFSHFPIVEDGIYLGCLSSDSVDDFDHSKLVASYKYSLDGFFVRKDMLYLEIMHFFAKNNTNVLPVLDNDNSYLGYYELENVLQFFNETPFLIEPGHIIVVEKATIDYMMAQIVQIVESNNGRLLGCFISKSDIQSVQITIKTGLGSINEILQAFRRYEYDVLSVHEEDVFISNLKERSEYLEKYLNI